MKRIEKNNDLLCNLTEQNMELEPARKRRRKGGTQFKSIQEHAKTLYSVINRGWTCNCAKHQANLRLDDRLRDVETNDAHKAVDNNLVESPVQFQVLFSVHAQPLSADAEWMWQETEIRVLGNNEIEVTKSIQQKAKRSSKKTRIQFFYPPLKQME